MRIFVLLAVLILSMSHVHAETKELEIYDNIGLARLGRGYNSVTGEYLMPCIAAGDEGSLVKNPGTRTSLDASMVNGSKELTDKLSIGVDILAVFTSVSAGAIFNFTDDTSLNSTWVHAVIHSSVRNSPTSLNQYKWESWLTDLARSEPISKQDFGKMCGNFFVAGYISGGEFWAVANVETNTAEEQQAVTAKLTAKFDKSHLDAEAQAALKAVTKSVTTSIQVIRWGGTDSLGSLSIDDLQKEAADLPHSVASNPWPIAVVLVSYDTIPPIVQNPFRFREQEDVMKSLAEQYASLQGSRNNALFAKDNPSLYSPVPVDADLTTYIALLDADILAINKAASKCFDSIDDCQTVTLAVHPPPTLHLKSSGQPACIDGDVQACSLAPNDCPGNQTCQGTSFGKCEVAADHSCDCKDNTTSQAFCPTKDNSIAKACPQTLTCKDNKWSSPLCDESCICGAGTVVQSVECKPYGCTGTQQCNSMGTGLVGTCNAQPPCPPGYSYSAGDDHCTLTVPAAATNGFSWSKTQPGAENVDFSSTTPPPECMTSMTLSNSNSPVCDLTFTLGQITRGQSDCRSSNDKVLYLKCKGAATPYVAAQFTTNGESGRMSFPCQGTVTIEKGTDANNFLKGCGRHMGSPAWHVVYGAKTCTAGTFKAPQ